MNNKRKIWIKHIQDYRSSGLTAAKWCEKNDLSINSLRYYIHKFNKEKKEQEAKQTKWATVVSAPSEIVTTETQTIKIKIGQATIEVGPAFDHHSFETVVRTLMAQC